ncbi:MAG: hypothetical protein HWE27_17890 [Gammaproteobacteria bacterium]|nr:hypothetical protein [Gammaproteobacteria bacterium]
MGLRFTNINISKSAQITRAFIQFTTDEVTTGNSYIEIYAENSANPSRFDSVRNNISNRKKTDESILWTPSGWESIGESGTQQRTPDLSDIVQSIVNRNDWQPGNNMVFIFTGNGRRTAESYDGSSSRAARLVVEYLEEDDGNTGEPNSRVKTMGSSSGYSGNDKLTLSTPAQAKKGDLLMLFLSRTDDLLPIRLNGWNTSAACFKTSNGQSSCHEIPDCVNRDGDYCLRFNGGNGRDLATVVFTKSVSNSEPNNYSFNLRGSKPTWSIMTALRGVDLNKPIIDVATESNDGSSDSLFPSVYGEKNGLLLLSMAFDDTAQRDDFGAPNGMSLVDWTRGSDEAGFLYSQSISSNGETGSRKTRGPGGPNAKDALISLTVRASTSDDGDDDDDNGNNNGGDTPTRTNSLQPDQTMNFGDRLTSTNGNYRLYFQGDGNLVLRDTGGNAIWASGTHNRGGDRFVFQDDGNLVIYANGNPLWASDTDNQNPDRLVLNDNGSLVLYRGTDALWWVGNPPPIQ